LANVLALVSKGLRTNDFSNNALIDMLKMVLYIRNDSEKQLSIFNSLGNSIYIGENQIVVGNGEN